MKRSGTQRALGERVQRLAFGGLSGSRRTQSAGGESITSGSFEVLAGGFWNWVPEGSLTGFFGVHF